MKFAVTGGAGFIGSNIVRQLLADGHEVTIVDNLSRGSISNIEDVLDGVDFVNADIREYSKMHRILNGMDGIFHQAALAYVPGSYEDKDEYKQVNVTGSENIFRISLEHNIKIIYASSSTVYGNTYEGPATEETPRRPLNPYGMTKLDAEHVAEKYVHLGAHIISLRYFNVVGWGRKKVYLGVIPRFLDRLSKNTPPIIHGDGTQIKDFVFVSDVVHANISAMTSNIKDGFFNIGSGKPVPIMDLALLAIKISGRTLKPEYSNPRPGDAKMCVADISKAAELLNWRPSIFIEEGLRNLINHP